MKISFIPLEVVIEVFENIHEDVLEVYDYIELV